MYAREAHPGEDRPAHKSFDDKLAAATRLRDEIGISRDILVDDLDGTVHRAYGGLPNMTWVLGRGGTILYKATWTSAARVDGYFERNAREPTGRSHTPFHTEQIEWLKTDRAAFARGLERNGPSAVAEYARAETEWTKRARASVRARRPG